jgi:hypothetical protein
MSMRSWAVGAVATAAVVAGVVVVQSGISGIAALPVLPHRTVAPAVPGGGMELPAPAEVSAPPPSAGTVQEAPVVRAEVMANRSATDQPAKRVRHTDEKPAKTDKGAGKDGGKGPDKGSTKDAKDAAPDSHGGPGQG